MLEFDAASGGRIGENSEDDFDVARKT